MDYGVQSEKRRNSLEKQTVMLYLEKKNKKNKNHKLSEKIQELEKKIVFYNNFISSNDSENDVNEIIKHLDSAIKTINYLVISNGILINKKNNSKAKTIECE